MLIGEYTHSLDAKKRLSLPSKFRKEVGKKVVITQGLDNCLFVYSLKEWEKETEKLANVSYVQSDSRGYSRFVFASAVESDVDAIGRILIPDHLKLFAHLEGKVAVLGVHSRIELWNEDAWVAYKGRIEKQADILAEKLGEKGVL